jgi:uncharacterized membrane protein
MAGRSAREQVTWPRPGAADSDMAGVLRRNIDAMREQRRRDVASASRQQKIAQAITDFAGSMRFVYLHLAVFGAWIVVNLGWIPLAPRFDPTFVVLAMVASVEAIFISTFVLIAQNRSAAAAEKRADLDLQINLLAEHEITQLIGLVSEMAEQMGIERSHDPELEELAQDVAPEVVLEELDEEGRERRSR